MAYFQSVGLLVVLKPDVVFLKGGYVGLPIGLGIGIIQKTFHYTWLRLNLKFTNKMSADGPL